MRVATRTSEAGTELALLVLAAGRTSLAGLDLASGALLRASWPAEDPAPELSPYDVVRARLADAGPEPAPSYAPDAVALLGAPERTGVLRGRKVERYLRRVAHPDRQPLFGFAGATVPFWELRGDRPSLAVVQPERGPLVVRDGERMRCRFRWHRQQHDLPLDDPRLRSALDHPAAARLAGGTLRRALGWEPRRLLVALSPPHQGRCYKVVVGLLPRP